MRKILPVIVLILSLKLSFGQFPGNSYPTNVGRTNTAEGSINTVAPENWIPDTVPLRIVRFYRDELGFYVPQKVDTNTYHFELLRPAEHYNDVWLGNLSYAWYPNDFEKRMTYQYRDFYFLNGFMDKIYSPSNIFFFRTNRPYTDLYYTSSPKISEQQIINTIHTQNVNFYTNFGLIFNTYTSLEPVTSDNSAVSTLVFWIATDKPRYKYNFTAFLNSIKLLENGGMIDNTSYFNPESPQYYLTNGVRTKIGFRGLSFTPEYLLKSFGNEKKLSVQANLLFARHTHSYFDPSPRRHLSYYEHYFIDSTQVFDSVGYDLSKIEANVKYSASKLRYVLGAGDDLQSFYYFIDYIFRPRGILSSNFYVHSGVEGRLGKSVSYSVSGRFYFYGRRAWDYRANARLSYAKAKSRAGVAVCVENRTPNFFQMIYSGNVAQWYNLLFSKEFLWSNKVYFSVPSIKFYVDLQYWLVKNYIHFVDREPYQEPGLGHVFVAHLRKDTHLGFIHFDNSLTLQYSPQNQIFNLPLAMVYSSLWFKFFMFKHALGVNTGVDVYYNSGFKQYQYDPSVMAFYFSADAPIVGQFPIANLFINFKVKRADIFIKFDYVDYLLNKNLFYAPAKHYHYPQLFFRYGARWWFKN